MFKFPIHEIEDVSLEYTSEDLSLVHKIAFDFQLYYLTLNDLHSNLRLRSSEGLMSHGQFRQLFRDLGSLPSDDRKIDTIFRGFDRTESGYCDITELTCGLSVLCQGSKSSKLLFAFRLLDEDSDDFLTRRGIWRFIRSFLCVLVAMSSTYSNYSSENLNSLLDNLSVRVSSEILANDAKRASFDMISSWYSTKGYLDSTWIELLDLKKWIEIPDGSPRKGDVPVGAYLNDSSSEESSQEDDDEDEESSNIYSQGDDEDDNDEDDNDEDDNDEDGTYETPLVGGHSLIITPSDTAHVLAVAAASGLNMIDSNEMVSRLSEYSNDGMVTKTSFLEFLNSLGSRVSNEIRNEVYADLFSIYNIFEHPKNSKYQGAEFHCLAVGLTILCNGSKSAKLEIGFRIFEQKDPDTGITCVSYDNLYNFLTSYLLVFKSLNIIENTEIACDTARALTQYIEGTFNDSITFPSFGKWYNAIGYNYAPWIELLNLEKWEKITGYNVTGTSNSNNNSSVDNANSSSYDDENDEDSEDSEDSADSEDEENTQDDVEDDAFEIQLRSSRFTRTITVSKVVASKVFHFTRFFNNQMVNINDLCKEMEYITKEGLIKRSDFLSTLNSLNFSDGNRPDETIPNIELKLHNNIDFAEILFDSFDRSQSGYCDLKELMTGLIMLDHNGSKSDKLVCAFDFIDKNQTGKLSKREIWKFFRSFLLTVILLACPDAKPTDWLHILVDESAVWLVENILNHIAKGSSLTPSHVTFDDIAEWYSSSGCSNSAWIELIDFSKWIYLSS
jgi:Ca2+-binding EF-hand superfamily protein